MRRLYVLLLLLVLAAPVLAGCVQKSKPEVQEVVTPTGTPAEAKEGHEEGEEAHEEAVIVHEGEAAVTVTLKNFEFSPANVEVKEGQIVEFRNEEGRHTVTIAEAGHDEPLIDVELSPGESVLVKFNGSGSYDLVCTFHEGAGMVGRIIAI